MNRRAFLQVAGLSTGLSLLGGCFGLRREPLVRPNIIFIMTDQQSAHMMSCAGNRWLKTPAMDYIARNGIRFERAYTTNPVCAPARISMMTGRFPGFFTSSDQTQPRENRGAMRVNKISAEVERTTIAAILKKAGYELAYGGKRHLPKILAPTRLGFTSLTGDDRDVLAEKCAEFIKQPHERPYFLWANFINPHDICYYAINHYRFGIDPQADGKRNMRGGVANKVLLEAMKLPEGVSEEEFFATHCPPLPPNHEPQDDEPVAVKQLLEQRDFRWNARQNYNEKDWRLHRWAYHRLTERVDRQIQVVLDALRESGEEANTVIILTSDHGDMDSAHKMEHKTCLYEESARIPFLVMQGSGGVKGRVDRTHLVSSGLDLLPTVCDYAGIRDAQADPRDRSLRPLIEGRAVKHWRQTLGVESEIGRMVVGDGIKYIKYDFVMEQEQLLDLRKDPGETRHFTNDPKYAGILKKMRKSFNEEWFGGH
ncbi:MAG: sulfatase-like hydrolase/transferase [Planctomycetes bacterium]|nr:sulfatase-like hydrolase/transferase [Planctomycetota bacterium]